MTPTEKLLSLPMLQPENIESTLHAYQMAKRCNVKRVMTEAVKWGERGAHNRYPPDLCTLESSEPGTTLKFALSMQILFAGSGVIYEPRRSDIFWGFLFCGSEQQKEDPGWWKTMSGSAECKWS